MRAHTDTETALQFLAKRPIASTADLAARGVSRTALTRLVRRGVVERLTRGVYRLIDAPPDASTTFAAVSARVDRGVLCLLSALEIHELTLTLPAAVWVAVPRGTRAPTIDIPTEIVWMSENSWRYGIETRRLDGVDVRLTTPAKTIADCFKYRSRIGLDIALEALREYHGQRLGTLDAVWEAAAICRVQSVIRPYLEAIR